MQFSQLQNIVKQFMINWNYSEHSKHNWNDICLWSEATKI